jgi:hypothetical protein
MAQGRSQTVRFDDETVQIETVIIHGIECLRLEDVQLQFPSVTALCIDNVQLAFIADEHGKNLKPLHVKANKDQVIEARGSMTISNIDLQDQLNRIDERMIRLQMTSDRIDANTQEILNQMRYLMTQMYELHEFTTPRYFFILPAQHHDWAAINTVQNLFQVHYKLYFLCECSDEPEKLHIAPHEGYSIKKPQAFIARYGPYLRTTLRVVQVLLTLGGFVIPQLGHVSTVIDKSIPSLSKLSTNFGDIKKKVELVENLLDKTDTKLIRAASPILQQAKPQGAPLQGADLRELESYLQLVDSKNSLGNLYRIVTTDGHVRWVCLEHYDAISFNNKMSEYIRQLETIGGQFNQEKKEALITQVNLTNKNVTMLCETLKKGFNIAKLVLQKCSIYEGDLDILLDVIINRSSIHCLKMTDLDVRSWIGKPKYVCEYMILHFNNQSLKVRCHDHYQSGNTQVFTRVLVQNKIHRTLDFSACDFFGQEKELQRCLDANGMLTGLVVNYSNNVDVLNAISTLKTNTLQQLKLNYSLGLPSTSSRFCEILKNNRTLVEIDLMDSSGFADETFIINLLSTLREHKSIKHLNLHVCYITPSNQKEDCLRNSLLNDKFISRLCLSKSVISHQLTQALVHASQEYRSLTHLEFYDNQMNADDVSQLQSLYKNENLIHLIISEEPSDGFKNGK